MKRKNIDMALGSAMSMLVLAGADAGDLRDAVRKIVEDDEMWSNMMPAVQKVHDAAKDIDDVAVAKDKDIDDDDDDDDDVDDGEKEN